MFIKSIYESLLVVCYFSLQRVYLSFFIETKLTFRQQPSGIQIDECSRGVKIIATNTEDSLQGTSYYIDFALCISSTIIWTHQPSYNQDF